MSEHDNIRLPAAAFAERRRRLLERLGDSGFALLAAGVPPHLSADAQYPFLANRNFYYLTGIEQEKAALLLKNQGGEEQAILFLPPVDPMVERWHGRIIRPQEASFVSGIADVRPIDELTPRLENWLAPEGATPWVDPSASDSQSAELREMVAARLGSRRPEDLSVPLTHLRMIKSEDEIELIRAAAAMTGRGIAAMAQRLGRQEPGLAERHLWNAFACALAEEGCLQPAFPSIVAAGANVFCLHYGTPVASIRPDDLIQIDVGASVGGMAADISRVLPASGRFNDEQRRLYTLVRSCQETAFATICPGIRLSDINEACRRTAEDGLRDLGILLVGESVGDYFWHNVSHHLGLDVHDVAARDMPLQAGMVLTVEPGIYVVKNGIGMRLEDDVVVTTDGCQLLSTTIPREADDVEALING